MDYFVADLERLITRCPTVSQMAGFQISSRTVPVMRMILFRLRVSSSEAENEMQSVPLACINNFLFVWYTPSKSLPIRCCSRELSGLYSGSTSRLGNE